MKKKKIKEYAQLTTKIREGYAKLQRENDQLKIELHKYKTSVEQLSKNILSKTLCKLSKVHQKKESIIPI